MADHSPIRQPGTTLLNQRQGQSDAAMTRVVLPSSQITPSGQQCVIPQAGTVSSGPSVATTVPPDGITAGAPSTPVRQAGTIPARQVTAVRTSATAQPTQPRQNNGGMERRVAWLEEDMAKLTQRYHEACEGFADDPNTRQMILALTSELAAERHAREMLEIRLTQLEDAVLIERNERESQLSTFSAEIEKHMKALITRIDDGLVAGAAAMRERSDATEVRLRTLIKRVDEGLSAGAAALQDTLSASGCLGPADAALAASLSARPSRNQSPVAMTPAALDPALEASSRFRSQGATPALSTKGCGTPNLRGVSSAGLPSTLQVPGSGLQLGLPAREGPGGGSMLASPNSTSRPSMSRG
mmetsp:Transcript_69967/g.167956  ORF Transcript_69967/g.167956 Transcript_69967/m.167956 type:complete len:357 (-) Transcript_69967:24-1094(-)